MALLTAAKRLYDVREATDEPMATHILAAAIRVRDIFARAYPDRYARIEQTLEA